MYMTKTELKELIKELVKEQLGEMYDGMTYTGVDTYGFNFDPVLGDNREE